MPDERTAALHQFLVDKDLYTKPLPDFETQFATEEAQGELYDFMVAKKVYTKSQDEFHTQFFNGQKKSGGEDGGAISLRSEYGDRTPTMLEFGAEEQAALEEERKAAEPPTKAELARTEYMQLEAEAEERDLNFVEQLKTYKQKRAVELWQEHTGMDVLRQLYQRDALDYFTENPTATEEDYNEAFTKKYERQLQVFGDRITRQLDEESQQLMHGYAKEKTEEMAEAYNLYRETAKVRNPIAALIMVLDKTFSRMPDQALMTDAVLTNMHVEDLEVQRERLARQLEIVPTEDQEWTSEIKQQYINKVGPIDAEVLAIRRMSQEEREQLLGKVDQQLRDKKNFVISAAAHVIAKRKAEGEEIPEKIVVEQLSQIEDPIDVLNYIASATGEGLAQIPASILTFGVSSFIVEAGEIYADQLQEIQRQKSKELGRDVTVNEIIQNNWDNPEKAFMFGAMAAGLDRVGAGQVMQGLGKKKLRSEMMKRSRRIGEAVVTEFATEGMQTGLEQAGAGRRFNPREIFEAAVKGGVGAGPISAIMPAGTQEPTPDIDRVQEKIADSELDFMKIQEELAQMEAEGLLPPSGVEIDTELKPEEDVTTEEGIIEQDREQQYQEAEEGGLPTEAGRSDLAEPSGEITEEEVVQPEAEVTEEAPAEPEITGKPKRLAAGWYEYQTTEGRFEIERTEDGKAWDVRAFDEEADEYRITNREETLKDAVASIDAQQQQTVQPEPQEVTTPEPEAPIETPQTQVPLEVTAIPAKIQGAKLEERMQKLRDAGDPDPEATILKQEAEKIPAQIMAMAKENGWDIKNVRIEQSKGGFANEVNRNLIIKVDGNPEDAAKVMRTMSEWYGQVAGNSITNIPEAEWSTRDDLDQVVVFRISQEKFASLWEDLQKVMASDGKPLFQGYVDLDDGTNIHGKFLDVDFADELESNKVEIAEILERHEVSEFDRIPKLVQTYEQAKEVTTGEVRTDEQVERVDEGKRVQADEATGPERAADERDLGAVQEEPTPTEEVAEQPPAEAPPTTPKRQGDKTADPDTPQYYGTDEVAADLGDGYTVVSLGKNFVVLKDGELSSRFYVAFDSLKEIKEYVRKRNATQETRDQVIEDAIKVVDKQQAEDINKMSRPQRIQEGIYLSKFDDGYAVTVPDKRTYDGERKEFGLTKAKATELLNNALDRQIGKKPKAEKAAPTKKKAPVKEKEPIKRNSEYSPDRLSDIVNTRTSTTGYATAKVHAKDGAVRSIWRVDDDKVEEVGFYGQWTDSAGKLRDLKTKKDFNKKLKQLQKSAEYVRTIPQKLATEVEAETTPVQPAEKKKAPPKPKEEPATEYELTDKPKIVERPEMETPVHGLKIGGEDVFLQRVSDMNNNWAWYRVKKDKSGIWVEYYTEGWNPRDTLGKEAGYSKEEAISNLRKQIAPTKKPAPKKERTVKERKSTRREQEVAEKERPAPAEPTAEKQAPAPQEVIPDPDKPPPPPPTAQEVSLEKRIVNIEDRHFTAKTKKFKAGTAADVMLHYKDLVEKLRTLQAKRGVLSDPNPAADQTLTEEEIKALGRDTIVKDIVQPMADFIRQGKFKFPDGVRGTTLILEAWNTALEVVATSIEQGAKLADAIAKGVREFKKSAYYKSLEGGKKREVIDTFKLNVTMQLTTEYNKQKTKIQKKIEKTTGITRDRNYIKIDEYTALKERIRTLARGFREGARDAKNNIRQAQEIIRKFIRENLPTRTIDLSPIKKSQLNRINKLLAEAGDKPDNLEAALTELDKLFRDKAVAAKRKEIQRRLNRALATQRVSGIKQQKKMSSKHYSMLETADILFNNDEKAAKQKIKRLDALIKKGKLSEEDAMMARAERRALEFAGDREMAMYELNAMVTEMEPGVPPTFEQAYVMELLNMVNSPDLGLATLEGIARDLHYMVETGRTMRQAQQAEQQTRIASYIAEARSVVTGRGKKVVLTEEEYSRQKGFVDRLSNLIKSFRNIQESLPTLLESLSRYDLSETPFEGFLAQLGNMVADADIQRGISVNNMLEMVLTKAQQILGKKYSEVLKENSQKKTVELTIIERPTEPTTLRAETPVQTEETTRSGRPAFKEGVEEITKPFDMSIGEAIHYWQIWQQGDLNNDPAIKGTFQKMGWTQETMDQLENFITQDGTKPENLKWAEWQMTEFYPSYYPRINNVYRRLYGFDMPYVDNYVPTFRRTGGKDTDINLLDAQDYQSSVVNGSLKSRVPNTNSFQKMNADDLMISHIQKMEHFIHNSDPVNTFRKVFKDQSVRDAIEQVHGRTFVRTLDNFMDAMARGGTDPALSIATVNQLMSNFVAAKIGINFPVFAKQLTSFPAYMSGVDAKDLGKYIKYVAEFWTNPVANWKELSKSQYLQKRYTDLGFDQLLADNAEALKRKGFNPKKMRFRDYMMLLTKFGDKTAIITGGYGYYRIQQEKYQAQGMSVEQAKAKAMKDFETQTRFNQQSSELTDLSWVQRWGTMGKIFTMFQNSPLQYLRMEMAAITNLSTGRGSVRNNVKNLIIYHFVLPGLFQAVASGFTGADEDDYIRTFALGSLAYLFIVGDVAENFYDAATKGQGWGMSNYVTALNTQLKKALAELTEMKAMDFNDMSFYDLIDATKDISILVGDLTGVPINNVVRYGEGIYDVSTGRSKNYWRVAGWSDYALGYTSRRSDEMGLVKRNINLHGGRWPELRKEAMEFFGKEEFKKKEAGLKKMHEIYTTFGLDNPDVNFLKNKSNDNTERAEYLIELEENMGKFAFRPYYNKLMRKGVVTKALDEKFDEMKKEKR